MEKCGLENRLTEKFYDNVNGFIMLTKEEKKLLNTVYFQRLHHIKQLSLSYFSFPGAVHTRFAHSLGVLHITEKMIQQLKRQGCREFYDEKVHQITRLAALLHDIGHYPLSHTIEGAYMEYFKYGKTPQDGIIAEKETPISLKECSQSEKIHEFLKFFEKPKASEYNHEFFAGIVIKSEPFQKIFFELFPTYNKEDLDTICDLITGTKTEKEDYILSESLINSKLDADQMDYMKRDTINTGINASVDVDFIIQNMVCAEKDGKRTVAFMEGALQVIEQFILAKYYWYSNILYYDKTYIMNLIAQKLYTHLLIKGGIQSEYRNIEGFKKLLNDNPNEFFFFNDGYFWKKIEEILNSHDKDSLVYKLSEALITRKFPKVKTQEYFDKAFTFSKQDLIKSHCQVTTGTNKFKRAKMKFERAINAINAKNGEKLFGTPIEREIINVNKYSQPINIVLTNGKCLNIINVPNQFFQKFIPNENEQLEEKQYKESMHQLKLFRIYDFEEILSQS